MALKRLAAAAALLLFAACGRPPVRDEVTVQFYEEGNEITVRAETSFDLRTASRRVEQAQSAAMAQTDPWAVRFAQLTPVADEVTFLRNRGELERVTRTIRIPEDDLQRVFSDTSITVNLIRGEGWRELTFYPGSSSRASREQVRHFEGQLNLWSSDVARYFTAIDHIYDYLGEHPHRAKPLFAALLNEKEPADVLEDEEPLLTAVLAVMERVADRMDAAEQDSWSLAEEADLIYNPFPARVVVRVPREKELVIEPVDLFKAIAALEGKWISPDPLAALLKDEQATADQLAAMPRRSVAVPNAGEIAGAIREQLARPKTYAIRWTH